VFNPGWQKNLKIDYKDPGWAATGERLTKETFDKYRKEAAGHHLHDEGRQRRARHRPSGVMIASDGVPFVNGTGHPRGAGTFARVLGLYSREKGCCR
jgi:dihydroorotase